MSTNLPFVLISSSTPDCVVLGDAVDNFSYANLNKAFQTIIKAGTNKCQLFSLGKGRFYQEDGELTLDVGPFTAGTYPLTKKYLFLRTIFAAPFNKLHMLHLPFIETNPWCTVQLHTSVQNCTCNQTTVGL